MTDSSGSMKNISRWLQVLLFAVVLLYLGRALFVPMSFGLLVAIVAYPVCRYLENKGWPKGMAVTAIITATTLVFAGLLWLLVYEANILIDELPAVEGKLRAYSADVRGWLTSQFNITVNAQDSTLSRLNLKFENYLAVAITGIITATSSIAVSLFLIPVFAVLFLVHRGSFVQFCGSLAGEKYKKKLDSILRESITSYYRFVRGTFFVYCIVGVLNSVGLLLLGIEHAVLFGIVTAFMTIIPYAGIIISAALPVAVALITKDSIWYAIGVIFVFTAVQYLEANLIFPKVVGRQLGLSTWAVIVAMIIGTLLWGIAGMILFIPFAAILKIFSDNIKELKVINILLARPAD